ncbi:cytochrome P450 [Aspergillus germanicus]
MRLTLANWFDMSTQRWIFYARFFHPLAKIPGPFWASISRYWLAYQVSTGKADVIQRGLHGKYGPVVRIASDEISISDPTAVKIIYGIKSGFTKTDFYPPFAPGISAHGDHFSQQDEGKHAARRKFANNVYSMSSVLESEEYIDACTDVLLEKMGKSAKSNKVIDLGEWIQYTFDVVGELFFGQQFGFMRDEHDFGNYILSLDTLLPTTALLCVLPVFIRSFEGLLAFPFPNVHKAVQGFDEIRRAGKFWVTHRMQQMADREINRSDLLDKLDSTPVSSSTETKRHSFAGSDTTAIAIRSILYHLMKSPNAYDKLMADIDEANSDGRLSRPHVKYNEAIKLPYLVACCKKGMRMHPSVGLSLPRYVPAGGREIAGHYFPAGTKVGISAPVPHANMEIFGADVDPREDRGNGYHRLHFGAGSRTGIGKNISLAEIYKMIPQLLRSYRLELADSDKEWDTHNF